MEKRRSGGLVSQKKPGGRLTRSGNLGALFYRMECSGAHVFDDVLHGFPQAGIGLDALAHDLEGVDDCGVIPAAHLFADVLHATAELRLALRMSAAETE